MNEIVLKMIQAPGHNNAVAELYKIYKLDATPLIQALMPLVLKRH